MRFSRLVTLSALATAAACSDSNGPSMSDVAGTYEATAFLTTTNSVTTNELQRGATLVLVLTATGNVQGTLFIPGENANPDFTASMAGSWTLSGSNVSFNQAADTFVRNMTFVHQGSTLVGDDTFSGTRIQLTLTRQ